MSSARAYLQLARWPNALMAAAGVLVGAFVFSGRHFGGNGRSVALAALAAIALTVTANAWNDAADEAIDRIGHPERPIPSGRITPASARHVALGAAAAGVLLAAFASPPLGALSVLVVLLMLAYSPALKRTGLSGNLAAAFLASLPFYYGAWVVEAGEIGGFLVAWAFTLHFAREVAKDIDDARADTGHRRTVPLRWGPSAARWLVLSGLLLFAAPILLLLFLWPTGAAALIPALALLVLAAFRVFGHRPGAPRVLKVAMLFAMLGLVADRLFL